jgi:hypothetical protein
LNYGGTLVVSNAGAALIGGEVFTNFTAPAYSGEFITTLLPALSAGLNWHLGKLTNNGTFRVNRAPVANLDNATNTPSVLLQIPFASLLANDTDADADTLTVSSLTLTTTNGITLTTNATTIFYTNPASVTDRFTYTLSDGSGGSATGIVQITSLPISNVPPAISTQPQSQSVKAGSNVTFTVSATGTPTPTYQWRLNNATIPGATNPSYTRVNVQTADAGNYSVLVTNVVGSLVSSNALLTVIPLAPLWFQSIAAQPDGRMTLVVTGEPGYAYWLERGTNLSAWQTLTNLFNTNGTSTFTDDSATNLPAGFYRARQ